VLPAADFLADDGVVMFIGDNLIEGGITDFVDRFRDADADALLKKVPDPERFGDAELAAGG
jgi:glucose-1-phosphate thymidylyltransferase